MRISYWSSDVCSSDLFVTTPGKVVTITAVAAPGARDAASIDVAITGCKFLKALEIFVPPAAILNPVVILLKNCIPPKLLSTVPIVLLISDRKSVVYGKIVSVRVQLGRPVLTQPQNKHK